MIGTLCWPATQAWAEPIADTPKIERWASDATPDEIVLGRERWPSEQAAL